MNVKRISLLVFLCSIFFSILTGCSSAAELLCVELESKNSDEPILLLFIHSSSSKTVYAYEFTADEVFSVSGGMDHAGITESERIRFFLDLLDYSHIVWLKPDSAVWESILNIVDEVSGFDPNQKKQYGQLYEERCRKCILQKKLFLDSPVMQELLLSVLKTGMRELQARTWLKKGLKKDIQLEWVHLSGFARHEAAAYYVKTSINEVMKKF